MASIRAISSGLICILMPSPSVVFFWTSNRDKAREIFGHGGELDGEEIERRARAPGPLLPVVEPN